MRRALLGLLGGTFDPIHNGHLLSALELQQRLQMEQLRLIPAGEPAHRSCPGRSAAQRLDMVRLAVAPYAALSADDRELRRTGPSYTVDTLEQLRGELGAEVALCWVMGMDAFASIRSWHRWQRLFELAHIVVLQRPGAQLPGDAASQALINQHCLRARDQLRECSAGGLWFEALTPHAVSASAIRAELARGGDCQALLPPAVYRYIERHRLYR